MSAPEQQVRLQADVAAVPAAPMPLARDTAIRLALLGGALAATLWVYRGTVASLLDIWGRSDTFAHGYLVAPISCWLIWRERECLRRIPVSHSFAGILVAGIAGFAWLLGELASVASVSQFALVGLIIALVWAVLGTQMARALAFPLGFLFFLVPFGEFLFPWMMDRTTDFVIGGLRLFGVPVYAEGRSLVIPSGHWQVVEGCSGVRYLIASVVVGSLYAHLTYRSLSRRLTFVALSVVLPILANWIRAWGIVMLAHVSDNRIAAGVDHLIYGWVFFGLVMLLLFWVGGRWREDEATVAPGPGAGLARGGLVRPRYVAPMLALAVFTVLLWPPVLGALDSRRDARPVAFPALQGNDNWVSDEGLIPAWSPRYSGMQSELRAGWAAGDKTVGVYVAYYRNQEAGTELISSENRILLNKDPEWTMAASGSGRTRIGSQTIDVHSTEIINKDRRLLVWNWYWVGGRWTSSDHVAKLYQAISMLSGRGDDAAAVMLYTPIAGGRERAEEALGAFAHDMGSGLGQMLAQMRGG